MIRSWQAFLIGLATLFLGMVWATILPKAPYGTFAPLASGLTLGYLGKRLYQKAAKFSPCNGGSGGE